MPNLQGAVNAGCNLRNGESLPLFLVLVFRLGCARLPITAATSNKLASTVLSRIKTPSLFWFEAKVLIGPLAPIVWTQCK